MQKIKIYLLLILFFNLSNTILGQSEFGVTGGANHSNFFNYGSYKEYYDELNYKAYNNYTGSFFYKEQIDEKEFMGFEIENMVVKSNVILKNITHTSSYYQNVLYNLNYLNFYFLYESAIISINRVKLLGNFSLYYGYLLDSKAKGSGWNSNLISQVDTNGNTIYYTTTKYWEKNETSTKEISKTNIGVRLGLCINIFLSKKLSLLVGNSYNFGIYKVLKTGGDGCIRDIAFTIGLSYKIDRKYLNLGLK